MYDLRYTYHTRFEHWLSALVPVHESLLVLRAHAVGTETWYAPLESNQPKAANLAESAYKTPLNTCSDALNLVLPPGIEPGSQDYKSRASPLML